MKLFEPDSKLKIRAQMIWFFMWLGVTCVGLFLKQDPQLHGTHQQLGLPPCPSVLMFNRPCPGCGLTTSWTALLHLDFATSWRAHPLGIPMYLGFTFVALGCLYGNIKGLRMLIDSNWANMTFVTFVVIFFIYGAARMAMTTNYQTQKEKIWSSAIRR
jgi:hypothetical protein